jgi:hypothetical protein
MQVLAIIGVMGSVALALPHSGPAGKTNGSSGSHVVMQSAQDFEWTGRIGEGLAIEVKGVLGDIRAVAASGTEVAVTAQIREGRRGEAEDIEFEVIEHDGGVTICAVYPTPRRADEPNECRPGRRGSMNTRDNDVEVHFTVRVPTGVNFIGRTVNGEIDVESLNGDVEVHTVNGDVDVSTSGIAQATTVNGSIWVALGSTQWSGALEFETVNGSITVEIPDGVGADVSAKTVNGGIETDFPLTVQGRFSARRLTGTIGGGGPRLWLETVNGRIELRRR